MFLENPFTDIVKFYLQSIQERKQLKVKEKGKEIYTSFLINQYPDKQDLGLDKQE